MAGGNQEWTLERIDPDAAQSGRRAEEAKDPQPTPSQRCLLYTSFLDLFCAALTTLCDIVLPKIMSTITNAAMGVGITCLLYTSRCV